MIGKTIALTTLLLAVFAASAAKLESGPRVYPAGEEAEITITVNDQEILRQLDQAQLRLNRADARNDKLEKAGSGQRLRFSREGNQVKVRFQFRGEQMHTVRFLLPKTAENPRDVELGSIRFFSLNPELFALRPFKGDTHVHSEKSDGKYSPAFVAAYGRKVGFDFTIVSDHHIWEPSMAAKQALAGFDSGLEVITGEESHASRVRKSSIHMLSFGIDRSVTGYLVEHKEEFEKQIAERLQTLPENPQLDQFDREDLVASEIMAELARQFGGIAIFVHPMWQPRGNYNVSNEYAREIIRRGKFDALEIVDGGHGSDERIFKAICWYNDLLREGCRISFVGASDSHDVRRPGFGHRFTLVLAADGGKAAVLEAIRAGRSLAVRKFADSPATGILGPFEYIDYAYFLDTEYWPGHDRLCEEQGGLLLKAVEGDETVLPEIARLRREIEAYRENFFRRK